MRTVPDAPRATILHADLDAFYASVEQRDDPRLRDRPVIVGGGVVLSSSYPARAAGVRTAMSGARARRLCPEAIVVAPRFEAYAEASKAVFEVFADTTPLVEGLSIDEAFLDVGGLRRIAGSPADIARKLKTDVLERVGLPITVGVARTKFLAKVASGVAKPDGLLVVEPWEEMEFLHPLPVERLWGVGPATAARLRDKGIHTVADVAATDPGLLTSLLGRSVGGHLHALSHNLDPRAVQATPPRRSVGAQHALGGGRHSPAELDRVLLDLVDRVTSRMRKAGHAGRTVSLRVRFGDYTRASRSVTLPQATSATATVLSAARGLLDSVENLLRDRGITLIGVAVGNLAGDGGEQGALPLAGHSPSAIDSAVDRVRARFGHDAVTRSVLVGEDTGIHPPLLGE